MRTLLLLAALSAAARAQPSAGAWRFAVSGDSRNCGDAVMPLIARSARAAGAKFYWHLGDFRATYKFDEDMAAELGPNPTISGYEKKAWPDFIARQLEPFGGTPVYLAIGNHELIAPHTRPEYVAQFADWLDAPVLRARRLADDPRDRVLKTYYRWNEGPAGLVSLDNADETEFDDAQTRWFEKVLERAAADPELKTLIVGMHRALPNSFSCAHGMNESAQGTESGRRVYRDLLAWRAKTGKNVYVLASHSHFVMENIYATPYWSAKKDGRGVLPGWIVGAAGAARYPLPSASAPGAFKKARAYGWLDAEVAADGRVSFAFREVTREDVPADLEARLGKDVVDACFSGNATDEAPETPDSCRDE